MQEISSFDVVLRLGAAMVCGGVVGWERGRSHKPAGMRTHMLVCTGTAAFVLVVVRYLSDVEAGQRGLMIDPTRVLQGILAGVGLVAGGVIIQGRGSVTGLTTAATLWAITAVGAASGYGQFDIAGILTLLILLTTMFFARIDPKEHPESPRDVSPDSDEG